MQNFLLLINQYNLLIVIKNIKFIFNYFTKLIKIEINKL